MPTGAITEYIDVAQLTLYVFWIFFAGLIFYLRREDTREGYPLERDVGGQVRDPNFVFFPSPAEYVLPHGEGTVYLPNDNRDRREAKLERSAPWPGAHYVPTGNPMKDCVGPGAWAERSKHPELMHDGSTVVQPLRKATNFGVPSLSRDPRGFEVRGADDQVAGTVVDIWLDRAEQMARHLEVELTSGKKILLPLSMGRVHLDDSIVSVRAIMASQFEGVPTLAKDDEITIDEEERIQAYYGGGYMYATPKRSEPFV